MQNIKVYYSNGFYRSDTHSSIPADAIEITIEQWQGLLADQSAGKQIIERDGAVIAVDPAELLTDAEKAAHAAASVRTERDALLRATDYFVMPDYPLTGAAKEALLVYRQALRDITRQEGFPYDVVWPRRQSD